MKHAVVTDIISTLRADLFFLRSHDQETIFSKAERPAFGYFSFCVPCSRE